MLILLGVLMVLEGIVTLLQGIFSLRAAKDATKATPVWIMSIIAIVLGVSAVISSFSKGNRGDLIQEILALAVSCYTFYLANNIKKLGRR